MEGNDRITVSYLLDPRFQGGTSAAIAAELCVLSQMGIRPRLHAVESQMFSGRSISWQLEEAIASLRLNFEWNSKSVGGDLVVLHNPSFLKFDRVFCTRIVARELIVVTHENFLRPTGSESFDVAHSLKLIGDNSLALRRRLAPVSPYNRDVVATWLDGSDCRKDWQVLQNDWFNICDRDLSEPVKTPRDRRGRLSRPGAEKFPALDDLDLCFPSTSEANVILGADGLIAAKTHRPHWQLYEFNRLPVDRFFEMIDFMVYFTAPTWSESFGRVLAEAVSAGKVVISDKRTAAMLPDAIIPAEPAEVDHIIANFIAKPVTYRSQVQKAQKCLERFSPSAFGKLFDDVVRNLPGGLK